MGLQRKKRKERRILLFPQFLFFEQVYVIPAIVQNSVNTFILEIGEGAGNTCFRVDCEGKLSLKFKAGISGCGQTMGRVSKGTAGLLALSPVKGMPDIHEQVGLFLAEGSSLCLLKSHHVPFYHSVLEALVLP